MVLKHLVRSSLDKNQQIKRILSLKKIKRRTRKDMVTIRSFSLNLLLRMVIRIKVKIRVMLMLIIMLMLLQMHYLTTKIRIRMKI